MSPLGSSADDIWANYLEGKHAFSRKPFGDQNVWVARLNEREDSIISGIASEHRYKNLDRSVLLAIAASRMAVNLAGWNHGDDIGINIGSSRGATGLFEHHHSEFLKTGKAKTLASPTTTLGNLSSWVAQDLQSSGPDISHSITCSTGLHSLLNGIAWLRAGMADKFLVGGSEAPLTSFTIAQMQAMKIYSRLDDDFPCRAMDFAKTSNTMILGEAASILAIEPGHIPGSHAVVEGIGYATEALRHPTSISAEADCFQKSMKMALADFELSDIDAIIMHAPGTIAGDRSEMAAIGKIFGSSLPMLTGNKWLCGHTFAASGILSIEMALLMMKHNQLIGIPYLNQHQSRKIRRVLVNSVGFGGNAVSVVLSSNFDIR